LGHKKGFNNFKIIGDTTIIYLETRKGLIYEALIDTEDLNKIKDSGLRFNAVWKDKTRSYYVRATKYCGTINGKPKYEMIYLHHLIRPLPYPKNKFHVDHKNHNTLDNRKGNIEVKLRRDNYLNRKGANKNSKTGIRNVSYNKHKDTYIVQIQINGESTRMEEFNDPKEAEEYAIKMRQKYYGEKVK
jgi:hypothetical protein